METENNHIMYIAQHISDFAKLLDNDHILSLGDWLSEKRNTFADAHDWNFFVKNIVDNLTFYEKTWLKIRITTITKNVFEQVAYELQPGQNCSQLLLERTKKEILANQDITTYCNLQRYV
jgi:hypothetical protein